MSISMESFPTTRKNSPPLRVLVIDDESLIRWSIAETLAQAGCQIAEASSAKDALQRISYGPAPDVVLLDYRLPDSNDLTLLETIRRLLPESPVIMMTAYGTPDVLAGAMELGAYRVLTKPVDMHEVSAFVHAAYASRHQ